MSCPSSSTQALTGRTWQVRVIAVATKDRRQNRRGCSRLSPLFFFVIRKCSNTLGQRCRGLLFYFCPSFVVDACADGTHMAGEGDDKQTGGGVRSVRPVVWRNVSCKWDSGQCSLSCIPSLPFFEPLALLRSVFKVIRFVAAIVHGCLPFMSFLELFPPPPLVLLQASWRPTTPMTRRPTESHRGRRSSRSRCAIVASFVLVAFVVPPSPPLEKMAGAWPQRNQPLVNQTTQGQHVTHLLFPAHPLETEMPHSQSSF